MKTNDLMVIGLGANLGDRLASLRRAVDGLADEPRLSVLARSTTFETAPAGGPPQPDYLNAAILVRSTLTPPLLLARALRVERLLGRDRSQGVRWGPRVIDIDLLWWSGGAVDEPGLRLPHPHLHERAFAVQPLLELVPRAADPRTGLLYAEVPSAREPLRAVGPL